MDWTGHGSWQANAAAVVMILGSALFIEGTVRLRSAVLRILCGLAALFLVYVNTKSAVRNLSLASEAQSEAKAATLAGGSHVGSQRSQLGRKRKAQVEIAGETAVGTLEAHLQAVIASDPRQWEASGRCEAPDGPRTGRLCTRVAEARAKIEAAKARDKLDVELSQLPPPTAVEAPTTEAPVADAYVANVIAILKEAGFKPTERLVKAEEAMARALGFELLAALGPSCWLAFVNALAGGGGPAPARPAPKPAAQRPVKSPDVPGLPGDADDLDRCIADVFEATPAGTMKARDIRPLVKSWFTTRNKDAPSEAEIWARLGAKFTRDPNNGRPRYLGLKPRAKSAIRVVVNNE